MRFIVLTALRETRAAWKRLIFFFVCIAIGVGAIVALRSVIQSVRQVLGGEARTLIAADVLISTDRPWGAGVEDRIAQAVAGVPGGSGIDAVEMPTMARPADETESPSALPPFLCNISAPQNENKAVSRK